MSDEVIRQTIFERKLYFLVLISKIKYIVIAIITGGILGGATYYITEIRDSDIGYYQSDATFYVEYTIKPNGEIFYAYNEHGWSYVTMFDDIIDIVLDEIDFEMTKEEIYEIVSSANHGDYKILTVTVKSKDPSICVPILEAFEPAMAKYGEDSRHIDYIELATSPYEPKLIVINYYTYRAILGGAILAGIIMTLVLSLLIMIENTFRVQSTLSNTFDIPVIGTIFKGGEIFNKEEFNSNMNAIIKDKNIATYNCNDVFDPSKYVGNDGLIIEVVANDTSSATVDRIIKSSKINNLNVVALVLVEADELLFTSGL